MRERFELPAPYMLIQQYMYRSTCRYMPVHADTWILGF
jgi:hypothetical protein